MASNAPPVTPTAGLSPTVPVGGAAASVFPGNVNGGVITNPLTAADQGLGAAEVLWVNPVGAADVHANGTTFALQPGQSWTAIPGQTTPTTVNATTSGHKFSSIFY